MSSQIIVPGFPGVGKSHTSMKPSMTRQIIDADSSAWSWLPGTTTRNPNFVSDYLDHLTRLMQQHDGEERFVHICCSTHKAVLDELLLRRFPSIIVYPQRDLREEYIERYIDRGSPVAFCDMMVAKWDSFIDDLDTAQSPVIRLGAGEFFCDALALIESLDFSTINFNERQELR
jgi:hypothetical protein